MASAPIYGTYGKRVGAEGKQEFQLDKTAGRSGPDGVLAHGIPGLWAGTLLPGLTPWGKIWACASCWAGATIPGLSLATWK